MIARDSAADFRDVSLLSRSRKRSVDVTQLVGPAAASVDHVGEDGTSGKRGADAAAE